MPQCPTQRVHDHAEGKKARVHGYDFVLMIACLGKGEKKILSVSFVNDWTQIKPQTIINYIVVLNDV